MLVLTLCGIAAFLFELVSTFLALLSPNDCSGMHIVRLISSLLHLIGQQLNIMTAQIIHLFKCSNIHKQAFLEVFRYLDQA